MHELVVDIAVAFIFVLLIVTIYAITETKRVLNSTLMILFMDDLVKIIEDPAQWTQGALARTADDTPVHPKDRRAVKWSVAGAAMKLTKDEQAPDDFVKKMDHLQNSPNMTHEKLLKSIKQGRVDFIISLVRK